MVTRHKILDMFKDIITKTYPNYRKLGLNDIHLFNTGEGFWRGYVYDTDEGY